MDVKEKPVLSIGIIFKDEIRCLERCVKSLQPLRDKVPCELVMADTGSGDGSREIAAKYADILFDFPWINDFAAARNAVIERCSGEWYLSIDADEWLDEDIAQLVNFLTCRQLWERPLCGVMLRNYYTQELDGESNEFLAVRLALLSTGMRFTGAVHELWDQPAPVYGLARTLIHHDGYVDFDEAYMEKKHARNMELLRKKLAQTPKDPRTLLQCIESSTRSPSYEGYIRQAVAALDEETEDWKYYAPPILRYAVLWAAGQGLPELEEWSQRMLRAFPDSPFTNIDVAYTLFILDAEKQNYTSAIARGETYLRTLEDQRAGRGDYTAMVFGSFVMATQSREDGARAILADLYFQQKRFDDAREMLLSIDRSRLQPDTMANYVGVLMNLHAQGGEDLSSVMVDLWEKSVRSGKKEGAHTALLRASAIAFSAAHRKAEAESGCTHAYTLFLPLAGNCGLGTAAAILESNDRAEMERLLRTVDDQEEFPIIALERALLAGVTFPLPGQPLTLDEMDCLSARLAQSGTRLPELLDKAAGKLDKDLQSLTWARGLALAAVKSFDQEDAEQGMELCRAFVKIEGAFLPRYYAPEMLCDENIQLLPPMHRFGWYCGRAFQALDAGDPTEHVRLLRQGLETCPEMKPVVEFLLKQLKECRKVQATPELLALAEQVRTLLSQYPADDPAVVMLKQSAVYQKVSHLIEGPDLGVFGGLAQ